MYDTGVAQVQAKNLHSGSLFTAWAVQMLAIRQSEFFGWLAVVGAVWSVYFWHRQFKLRRELGCNAVRGLAEIWTAAVELSTSSPVLLLPLLGGCLLLLGYLSAGSFGLLVSCCATGGYSLLVLLAERYPIAEYA